MTEHEDDLFTLRVLAQFPAIFEPRRAPFPDAKPMYSVTFEHKELPAELADRVAPSKRGLVSASTFYPAALVDPSGRQEQLTEMVALAKASHIQPDRLIYLMQVMLTVKPISLPPKGSYGAKTVLRLVSVGIYATLFDNALSAFLADQRQLLNERT